MEIPYPLIIKFLNEECTPEEVQFLIAWRQESSKHESIFLELARTWDRAMQRTRTVPSKVDVWNRIQSQIDIDNDIFSSYSKRTLVQVTIFAASVALLIGLFVSFLVFYRLPSMPAYAYVETPSGQKSHVILPDGTKVWLNSGSKLIYSTDYNKGERIVRLTGEAFFDVVHNSRHPFVVNVGNVGVKDLGTAFDIRAYSNDSAIEVSLLRGSVSLMSVHDQIQIGALKPNQKAVIDPLTLACSVSACNATDASIWINNEIRFDGQSTYELFKQLDRWYGVHIAVANAPQDKRYWMTLKTESLTEALQLINKISPITYTINGEEVHVKFKP